MISKSRLLSRITDVNWVNGRCPENSTNLHWSTYLTRLPKENVQDNNTTSSCFVNVSKPVSPMNKRDDDPSREDSGEFEITSRTAKQSPIFPSHQTGQRPFEERSKKEWKTCSQKGRLWVTPHNTTATLRQRREVSSDQQCVNKNIPHKCSCFGWFESLLDFLEDFRISHRDCEIGFPILENA